MLRGGKASRGPVCSGAASNGAVFQTIAPVRGTQSAPQISSSIALACHFRPLHGSTPGIPRAVGEGKPASHVGGDGFHREGWAIAVNAFIARVGGMCRNPI